MNTRGGLYHKLVCEHRKVTDHLSAVQEQLHQAQGISLAGTPLVGNSFSKVCLFRFPPGYTFVPVLNLPFPAASKSQVEIDALTSRIAEIQGIDPAVFCALCLHLFILNFLTHALLFS